MITLKKTNKSSLRLKEEKYTKMLKIYCDEKGSFYFKILVIFKASAD